MKFTDLPPTNRSLLAALCAAGTAGLRTDALGRAVSPRHATPQEAANLLNNMRMLGLVYSQQKPDNQAYALWKASEYGVAVFMSRPNDVPSVPATATAPVVGCADAILPAPQRLRIWMIYPGTIQYKGSEASLTTELAALAQSNPGTKYMAYLLHSEAVLPVPTAQITLL